MSKNIIDVYKSVLNAAGMVSDNSGFVSINNELYADIPNAPAMIGEKRLVLPTDEHLRNPSGSKVVFHPLREQATHGESEVVVKLRTALSIRLNFTIAAILNELISICYNVGGHKNLNPEQTTLVEVGKNVSEDTHVVFTELMKRSENQLGATKSYVTLYVKKNANINGTNYFRAGIATFPMYEELKKEDTKPLGYAISKKERANLIALFEYLIPGIEKTGTFEIGSNSGVAPHLEGLMRVFGAIGQRLNDKYELFENIIGLPGLKIDMEWAESFDNLETLLPQIQHIPTQVGNEGKSVAVSKTTETQSPAASAPVSAPQQPQSVLPVTQQPQQHAASAQPAQPATGTVSWRSVADGLGLPPTNNPMNPMLSMQQLQYAQAMANGQVPRSDWNSKFAPANMPAHGMYPMMGGYPQHPMGGYMPQVMGGYPQQIPQQMYAGYQSPQQQFQNSRPTL